MSSLAKWIVVLVMGLAVASAAPIEESGSVTPTPRIVAEGTTYALDAVEPVILAVPPLIAEQVQGETALFYFSPTCPHCQQVMPEINALVESTELKWIGIASGSSTAEERADFERDYTPAFAVLHDVDRLFAMAVGARSTPSVYLVRPAADGVEPALEPVTQDSVPVEIYEGYAPYVRGSSQVIRMRLHRDAPFAGFDGYVGPVVCELCHTQEAMSLSLTHHAIAYATIYERERADDPECVRCHVTALGAPGGFELGDHGSPAGGVGCEACHGPSGPHDGTWEDPTAACAGCHDAKHSIGFTLQAGLPLIDHFAANDMTEIQLQERYMQLVTGQAPLQLVSLPEGPTVGAAACRSCHGEQHRGWRKGGHADAARSISAESTAHPDVNAELSCETCHATPGAIGMGAGGEPARTDEGVGCESCHGAGGDHVQAPSQDNIIGLGERCSECVVEEICTGCHTRDADPKWELKRRLQQLKH